MRSGPGRSYVHEDVLLLQDLADRAGLAIDNARLYRDLELRVRERTAELEIFTQAVAHNLRTPLRSIYAFGDALHEDGASLLDARSLGHLQRIRTAAARANETVDALLHLSRLAGSELRREQVDLSALVVEVVAHLRESNPDHAVDVRIETGMETSADERLLELALTMVLSSSWRSTCSQSSPRIEIRQDREKVPPEIIVQDNGIEPHDEHGLSHSIARRVIDRHGGSLWVACDRGATYRFTLSR